jgi:hypothetical protein
MKAVIIKKEGEDPRKNTKGGVYNRAVKRNKKTGELEQSGDLSSDDLMAQANATKQEAKPNDRTFDGTAAPRVGGGTVMKQGLPSGGSKKQIKAAKVRVKRSSASPAAKASARRLYR